MLLFPSFFFKGSMIKISNGKSCFPLFFLRGLFSLKLCSYLNCNNILLFCSRGKEFHAVWAPGIQFCSLSFKVAETASEASIQDSIIIITDVQPEGWELIFTYRRANEVEMLPRDDAFTQHKIRTYSRLCQMQVISRQNNHSSTICKILKGSLPCSKSRVWLTLQTTANRRLRT